MRTSPSVRSGMDHTVLPVSTPYLPLPRKRSPGGATTCCEMLCASDSLAIIALYKLVLCYVMLCCCGRHLIATYYSFIDPKRMKGWVGLTDLQRTVYSHKWSPVSCRSSAGQGKFAGPVKDRRSTTVPRYRSDANKNWPYFLGHPVYEAGALQPACITYSWSCDEKSHEVIHAVTVNWLQ